MKNQYPEKAPRLNRYIEWMLENDILAKYIDTIVRAFIGLIIGISLYFILLNVFKLGFVASFIIIFIIIISLNPLLNKIKVGLKIQKKYLNFIMKYI